MKSTSGYWDLPGGRLTRLYDQYWWLPFSGWPPVKMQRICAAKLLREWRQLKRSEP